MFVSTAFLLAVSASFMHVMCQNGTNSSSVCDYRPLPDTSVASGTAGGLWPIDENGSHSGNTSAYYNWLYSVQPDGQWNMSLSIPAGSPIPDNESFWSICYLMIDLPVNVIERAQEDNGSCRSALDGACVDELVAVARGSAIGNTPEAACRRANTAVFNATGSGNCTKFFGNNGTSSLLSSEINSPKPSSRGCYEVSRNAAPGHTLIGTGRVLSHPLRDFFNDTGDRAEYNRAYRTVHAILSLYLPNTNTSQPARQSSGDSGQFADINCPRVNTFVGADNKAPSLPSPSPVNSGSLVTPHGSVMTSAVTMVLLASFLLGVNALW